MAILLYGEKLAIFFQMRSPNTDKDKVWSDPYDSTFLYVVYLLGVYLYQLQNSLNKGKLLEDHFNAYSTFPIQIGDFMKIA